MATAVLYTPEVLGLATSLADFAWDEDLPLQAEARSRSCGSTISLGLALSPADRVDRIGLKSQACAIGQASAAIFAGGARGMSSREIVEARDAIERWLSDDAELPDWPGLEAIAPARDYPARHGAILLAWRAASDVLSRN